MCCHVCCQCENAGPSGHGIRRHSRMHAGGACLLSHTHRGLMDGVEMADSFAWNPHKMMVRDGHKSNPVHAGKHSTVVHGS